MLDLCVGARFAMALAFAVTANTATAQLADTTSEYSRSAFGIVPSLTALAVVRGGREERVASLAFLWPHDVSAVFAESPAARGHARRAFTLRRAAAIMTGAGMAVAGTTATWLLARHQSPGVRSGAMIGAGLAAVALSVPVHFAADGELSRAVWSYNGALFDRRPP